MKSPKVSSTPRRAQRCNPAASGAVWQRQKLERKGQSRDAPHPRAPENTRLCTRLRILGTLGSDRRAARDVWGFVRVLTSARTADSATHGVSHCGAPPSSPSTVTAQHEVDILTARSRRRRRGEAPYDYDPPHAIAASHHMNRERPLHPTTKARVVRELVVHRRAVFLLGHAPRQLGQLAERRPLAAGVLL